MWFSTSHSGGCWLRVALRRNDDDDGGGGGGGNHIGQIESQTVRTLWDSRSGIFTYRMLSLALNNKPNH